MIIGAHVLIHSSKPQLDRAFLRDVLHLPHIDVGDGWLIFGLPPSEVAVHGAEHDSKHELYLMCDDVEAFCLYLEQRGIAHTEARDAGWGLVTELSLPGGGKLGVYQPQHPRPVAPRAAPRTQKADEPTRKQTGPQRRSANLRAKKAPAPKAKRALASKAKKAPKKAGREARKQGRRRS